MIDPKLLRQSTAEVAANLARRGFVFDTEAYLALEERRKALQVETEALRSERNNSAKNIGKAKAQGEDIEPLLAAVKDLGDKLDSNESALQEVQAALNDIELGLPNLLSDDVPVGTSESDNAEVRRWGEPAALDFPAKDHIDLGENLGLLDFESASRISGARFTVMRGPLARLQRALIQFMLDTHTSEHGYEEAYVPYLVQAQALLGTGQLPKFEEDLFQTNTDAVLPDTHGRSTGDQPGARHHPGSGPTAKAIRRAHALFSIGSGFLWAGHARHDSPASVREGRVGAVC